MNKVSDMVDDLLDATGLYGFTVGVTTNGITFIGHEERLATAKIDGSLKQEFVISVLGCDGEERIGYVDINRPLDAIRLAIKSLIDAILSEGVSAVINDSPPLDDSIDEPADPYDQTMVFSKSGGARVLQITGT